MGISIVTPHFNDFEGIKQIHQCLKNQISNQWEWIIVDDCSDFEVKNALEDYFKEDKTGVKLIYSSKKMNASSCRNQGVEYAIFLNLVFLDSDDKISENFIANRLINVEEFTVFKNLNIFNDKEDNIPFSNINCNFLDNFLRAKFAWQTTAVLWNKDFFTKIGKFDSNLVLLEDVELSIRSLLLGDNYKILDNKEIDFYYYSKDIDIDKRNVKKVCASVNQLITSIISDFQLDKSKIRSLKGYYYLCVRYLCRSKNSKNVIFVKESLRLFYSKKCITNFQYVVGLSFLKLYRLELISNEVFMRINRYFFK